MAQKRQYEWFLEPRDSHTNEVISRNVGAANFCDELLCRDGQRRNLWRCLSGLVFMLWASRHDLGIKFRIFNRELPNGEIRDITDWYRSMHAKNGRSKRNGRKMMPSINRI